MCHLTGHSFPVVHQNPVLFLRNNELHLSSLPQSRHRKLGRPHPTKFLYVHDILFSSLCKNSSSILYYLYFEHWCRSHMYFIVQPFSTYFFKRIMGCHLSYCFSSSVIFDVLYSIKFCEHFFHCFLHFILSSPPTHRLPTHTQTHTHTPFPF